MGKQLNLQPTQMFLHHVPQYVLCTAVIVVYHCMCCAYQCVVYCSVHFVYHCVLSE